LFAAGLFAAGLFAAGLRPASAAPPPAPPTAAVDWNALFRLHYQHRVRAFREQNAAFGHAVLLGDSLTEGLDPNRYFPGRRILNRGIGGDVLGNELPADDPRGVLKRLDESVHDCHATHVFVMIGVNDLNQGRTPAAVEAGHRELLARLRRDAPRLPVTVQSLLPTRGPHAARNAAILDCNARLRAVAAEAAAEYLDVHALMADDRGELKAEFTEDGLHLTPAAYEVWKRQIEIALGWE
jgi:lysophospholipase L1-like esterase